MLMGALACISCHDFALISMKNNEKHSKNMFKQDFALIGMKNNDALEVNDALAFKFVVISCTPR